jgi:hypothetical protein
MLILADQIAEIGRQIEIQRILARIALDDTDPMTVVIGQFFE